MSSSPESTAAPVNTWDASLYDNRHAFVYRHGADLLDLLQPQSGQRVLDLGCGTGHLTNSIAQRGAAVVGIDASADMIAQAQRNFPAIEFHVADAREYRTAEPFDAVFSNAALHWVKPAEAAVQTIAAALKPGGRFVAEFGGHGNVERVLAAVFAAIEQVSGKAPSDINPWYFPSVAEYAGLLERAGLEVEYAHLFDRPTPLDEGEAGMANWLAMFGQPCLTNVPADLHSAVIAAAIERMRPQLWHEGGWTADYRRLRIIAVKQQR